ncbi:MAG TPA: NAD(P)-dependent oxidoreductase, partial [Candidatus Eisenbacteria bacterium]|nr:NAD(P)-dependent oxidoreductase [Candidatus Eisenbacteria bacterium]
VAVDLAEKIFGKLSGVRVLVIGTGEMSTQVTKAMISRGACSTIVSSRHYDRAEALALELGGQAVHFDDYELKIAETDILISATEAPRLLIHEKQVRAWMKARHERPLFLIDIAVPRNIETTVEKLDNVYLYNIDDLRLIADKNRLHRESQLSDCFRLIGDQTRHFMAWLSKEFGEKAALPQA